MVDHEVTDIAVDPPRNLDANLVEKVANVINKSPYQARLFLAGEIPKIIAYYDNIQKAESIVQYLRELGLNAITCKDSELRQPQQSFKAQTLELREKEILFIDRASGEKRIGESNVFLILEGRIQTYVEAEITKSRTKFSLTRTLLTGGIPMWHKVDEKTTSRSFQTEYFVRLYDLKSPDPIIEILQHHMNYSFLGAKIAASSLTNFGTVVLKLREIFPQAVFDDRLARPSIVTACSSRALEDIEINCKLIYLFHLMRHGLDKRS